MIMRNPADLGRALRQERRQRHMSQAELCATAGVSRRWLTDFESGKTTAEIALVFRVVHALGLVIEVSPWNPPDFDLDDIIRDYADASDGGDG